MSSLRKHITVPRGKQFGFLFTEGVSNKEQLAKTIAHELGHGYFQLKHPFEMGLKQGDLKDNLMDYDQGVAFNKYQWDIIHDPGIVTGLFESDSSGMRIAEGDRSKITRLLYALRDYQQEINKNFLNSLYLIQDDKTFLSSGFFKTKTLHSDHIFYDYTIEKNIKNLLIYIRKEVNEEDANKIIEDAKKSISIPQLYTTNGIPTNQIIGIYIKEVKMVICLGFQDNGDYVLGQQFMSQKDNLKLPHNTNRKVFFIHGTKSDNERWKTHPLTEKILLMIANTDQYDDAFNWNASLTNNVFDRNKAADSLVNRIVNESDGISDIVLVGHSHGGNVAIQAINDLVAKGKKVILITVATPSFNKTEIEGNDVQLASYKKLPSCECKIKAKEVIGESTIPIYTCKEIENPVNTRVSYHLHLWNKKDRVAGGLAGDDYYKNKITKNIEIPVGEEFDNAEWMDAHSLDSYRPQLIYELIKNGTIPKIP